MQMIGGILEILAVNAPALREPPRMPNTNVAAKQRRRKGFVLAYRISPCAP